VQQNWERRHPFVALEEHTISSMLQPVFPSNRLESFTLLTAGNCNTNYTFTIAGLNERFMLRIYVRDKQACQKDRDLFQLIQAHVPIPELLYTHIGNQPTNCTDGSDKSDVDNITYSVMKWVDGELFSDILARRDMKAIPECAYDIGKILATIGSYTFPQSGFFGPGLTIAEPLLANGRDLVLLYLKNILFQQSAGQQLGKDLTTRLWQFVNEHAAYLDALDGSTSLVHSDFM
jgi:Phosphotransferase enzyme family